MTDDEIRAWLKMIKATSDVELQVRLMKDFADGVRTECHGLPEKGRI